MARRIVTRDGTGLHVQESGPPTAPVTVLLAHGWTLDERCWAPVADVLANERSVSGTSISAGVHPRVIRYDHRAHGRSDDTPVSSMTLEQLADDMAEVIAQTCPTGPLVLAGHSMGGMTVMTFAQRHPDLLAERVRGVALVATASGGLGGAATLGLHGRPAQAFLAGKERLQGSPRWTERRELTRHPLLMRPGMRAMLLGRRPGLQATRLTCESVAGCRPTTVSGFTPTLTSHERDAALAAFADMPVEVMVGSRDRLTPPRLTHRIRRHLPRSSMTILPDAGHMLPVERVGAVATRIAALARQAAAAPSEYPADAL